MVDVSRAIAAATATQATYLCTSRLATISRLCISLSTLLEGPVGIFKVNWSSLTNLLFPLPPLPHTLMKNYLPTPRSAATSAIFCLTFSAALISTLVSGSSGNSPRTSIPPCPGQKARKREVDELDKPPRFSLYDHLKTFTGFGSSRKHDFIREV